MIERFLKFFQKEKALEQIELSDLNRYCYTCQHHKSYHTISTEYVDEANGPGWVTGESTGMHCMSLGRYKFNTHFLAKIKCRCYEFIPMDNLDYIELKAKQRNLV